MTYLPTDKIRVFVSSRLVECATERARAREVIESLGHQPVMFEGAGARPYAPRSVYLRGLEESQIFIGIYREGYGYIEEGMEISGLEDEYRFAKSTGVPLLLYVLRDGKKEARLSALIDEFTGPDITIGYFVEDEGFGEQLREDLIALVSDYFSRGRSHSQSLPIGPGSVADALVAQENRIRRIAVEKKLESQLEINPLLFITGPLGSGKTVLLSALSADRGWIFVDCGERPIQEIFADVANALRALIGLSEKSFLLPDEAQSALTGAWDSLQSITLVLDDVRHTETLDRVSESINLTSTHRLVISSRVDIETAGSVYEIPPLDIDEIKIFVEKNRKDPIVAGELVELQTASKGNPLYLRYYLSGEPGDFANNISEYESKVWRSLSGPAREILCYLSWSDQPLSLRDLSQLFTGSTSSMAELADIMMSASSFLFQSDRGYSIFHPHAKETIQRLTSRSRPNLQFYIERLAKWLFDCRDYAGSFSSLHAAGFPVDPPLLEKAGRQALVKGDFRKAIQILHIQIELAKESSEKVHERDLTLYLAHVESISGSPNRAIALIDKAIEMAVSAEPPFNILELKSTIGAIGKGDRCAFEHLLENRENYRRSGRMLDAARLSMDLCVYYSRQGNAKKAAIEAKFAMEIFEEHGNEYGFHLARLNYLSGISALPEKDDERDKLIREIEVERKEDPRHRALLCNVLARRARKKGDLSEAKAYSTEAADIGRGIGDNTIVCNNLINLGNSFRQEKNWAAAIAQYEAVDKLAREENLTLIEASAQEHLASVYNRRKDAERAIHHANYAISISRSKSYKIESDATEELAKAYEILGRIDDAIETWLRYGSLEIQQAGESEAGSYGLFRAVSLMDDQADIKTYVTSYAKLFGMSSLSKCDLFPGERLINDLLDLSKKISAEWIFESAVNHARFMYRGAPEVLIRRVYMVSMRRLFSEECSEHDVLKRLRTALAMSMALPPHVLRLSDIVDVGEAISSWNKNVSFRAGHDGAAHWNIQINLGKPVIVSVVQIDDLPAVSMITLCVSLVLIAFSSEIFKDVLSEISPQRSEVNLQICSFSQANELLPLKKVGLEEEPEYCAISRAVDVASDVETPIFVITNDSLIERWLPRFQNGFASQYLFATVLVEAVYHLQSGEVELDCLYPKVARLISNTVA